MSVVKGFVQPVQLRYTVNAGRASSRFLRGLVEGKILGQRLDLEHQLRGLRIDQRRQLVDVAVTVVVKGDISRQIQ